MEFLSMIGVVLAIFMGLLFLVSIQNQAMNELEIRTNQEQVCNLFATAINAAHTGGSGFTAYVTMPEEVNGQNYTLITNNKTVVVTANSKTVFCRILTNQLNSTGPMPTGELSVSNQNGTIFVE